MSRKYKSVDSESTSVVTMGLGVGAGMDCKGGRRDLLGVMESSTAGLW